MLLYKRKMKSPAPSLFSPVIPAPCFVVDAPRLRSNCAILDRVQRESGARILLALKAFSTFATFPLLSRAMGTGPLHGTCASSVHEARLGREHFGGEVHAFAAAFDEAEMTELLPLVDHITFNSIGQWRRFAPQIAAYNKAVAAQAPTDGGTSVTCGLRINPEHSEGTTPMYDPCAPGSRLGIRPRHFDPAVFDGGITGLHSHTLCEQNADALERTLATVEQKFGPHLRRCQWYNMGGGHHITRDDYDVALLIQLVRQWRERYGVTVYLEPGEAVALNAGWLTATVMDMTEADMPIAILDASAACHMPDVLEMPYTPPLWYRNKAGAIALADRDTPDTQPCRCRLAGKSCLAGDVIGVYGLDHVPTVGERLLFGDMAIYTMVKTNTFNGLQLPAIGVLDGECAEDFRLVRTFGYEDFKTRLS